MDESLEETFRVSDPPAVTVAATTTFAAPPLRATKDGASDRSGQGLEHRALSRAQVVAIHCSDDRVR